MTSPGNALRDLDLDYIEMFVEDIDAQLDMWCGQYGFTPVAVGGSADAGFRSVVVRRAQVTLVLTQAVDPDHPAAASVRAHGDGVADIALRTSDVRAVYEHVLGEGGSGLTAPWEPTDPDIAVSATVSGFGDVVHTLTQRGPETEGLPVGFRVAPTAPSADQDGFHVFAADHFAVIVGARALDATISYYERAFDFEQTFTERIVVGSQAMLSRVVQSRTRTVTFTVIAPDPSADSGQINDFLVNHSGAGVQHVALAVDNIVRAVGRLGELGVDFLPTPDTYYTRLRDRVAPPRHSIDSLREFNILVDEDHGGQLFQIFTRSVHPRRTLFFEVIERRGAETFGSSNIKALYEAVESERVAAS